MKKTCWQREPGGLRRVHGASDVPVGWTMVDKFLSDDLLRALDAFIAEQHPGMSRYDALRLAFHDWAARHGYLDAPVNETEVFPAGGRTMLSRKDRTEAGGMLDRFIEDSRSADGRSKDGCPPR